MFHDNMLTHMELGEYFQVDKPLNLYSFYNQHKWDSEKNHFDERDAPPKFDIAESHILYGNGVW